MLQLVSPTKATSMSNLTIKTTYQNLQTIKRLKKLHRNPIQKLEKISLANTSHISMKK